jgi:hypothetical protein
LPRRGDEENTAIATAETPARRQRHRHRAGEYSTTQLRPAGHGASDRANAAQQCAAAGEAKPPPGLSFVLGYSSGEFTHAIPDGRSVPFPLDSWRK